MEPSPLVARSYSVVVSSPRWAKPVTPAVFAACLVLVLGGCVGTAKPRGAPNTPPTASARPSGTTAPTSTAPTRAAASTTSTTVPSPPWPQTPIATRQATSFASLGRSLYAVGSNPEVPAQPAPVTRIDASTDVVAAVSVVLPAGEVVVAGQTLWLVDQPATPTSPLVLYRLNPITLTVLARISLPQDVSPALTPDGSVPAGDQSGTLWVGYEEELYRIDPYNGTVITEVATPNVISGLALDDHGRMYLSVQGLSPMIEQRSAVTGALQAAVPVDDIASVAFSPIGNGVWASYRSGMAGSSSLYAADTLTVIAPPPGELEGPDVQGDPFVATMGTTATVLGGVLWLTSIDDIACADPDNGAVRAIHDYPRVAQSDNIQVVAVFARKVFAYNYITATIAILTPPNACWEASP